MTFHWSPHAPHILSLFRSWEEGDGYSSDGLASAEDRLNLRFPTVLRRFYQAWGNRSDLTCQVQSLLLPHEAFFQSNSLVFCVENQGVWFWAIPGARLDEENPPVVTAWNEEGDVLWQPSHDRLSDFLDYLTYGHALAEGGLHGAYSHEWTDTALLSLIQDHYREIQLPSYPAGLIPDHAARPWSLFVGRGCVLAPGLRVAVAADTSDIVDQISNTLHVTWRRRW